MESNFEIRPGKLEDLSQVYQLVVNSTLDTNSEYFYMMMLSFFSETSCVVRDREHPERGVVAFMLGLSGSGTGGDLTHPRLGVDDYFCWQVAVHPDYRGTRLSSIMLDHMGKNYKRILATVTPENKSSMALFERYAKRHELSLKSDVLFKKEHFTEKNHSEEILLIIGS